MKHSTREIKLANGSQGLVIDIPDTQMVGFELSFRAGSYLCPLDRVELAHFMEHMICTANEEYDEKRFIAEISKNGAYTNAFTGTDNISYLAYCAEFEWERVLQLFLLAITKPKFINKHFIREKEVIKQELTNQLTNYDIQLLRETRKAINSFNHTTQTGLASLEKITLEDLDAFYRQTHYAQNMRFLIAGNIGSKMEKIEQIMSTMELPKGEQPRLAPFKSPLEEIDKPISLKYPEVDKFYFDISVIRPGSFEYEKWICINLLTDCLFGSGGIGSLGARITGPARDQGLIYSIDGGGGDFHDNLSMICHGRVEQPKAKELFTLITSEIEKLRQGQLTDSEFNELKERAAGTMSLREQTVSSLMHHYDRYFIKGEILEYDTYLNLLPSITKKQALEILESVLAGKHWYFSLLGAETDKHKDELYRTVASVLAK